MRRKPDRLPVDLDFAAKGAAVPVAYLKNVEARGSIRESVRREASERVSLGKAKSAHFT